MLHFQCWPRVPKLCRWGPSYLGKWLNAAWWEEKGSDASQGEHKQKARSWELQGLGTWVGQGEPL